MMEVLVEVCGAFALTVSVKKIRDNVYSSTAHTADDGASQSPRANLQTGATGRRDRNPGHAP